MGITQEQFNQMQARVAKKPVMGIPITTKANARADENRLEIKFYAMLRIRQMTGELKWIGEPQSIKLTLADRCTYTPDFPAQDQSGQVIFYETKGWMRDDALVKLKVAARMYPWAQFVIVEYKRGIWSYRNI